MADVTVPQSRGFKIIQHCVFLNKDQAVDLSHLFLVPKGETESWSSCMGTSYPTLTHLGPLRSIFSLGD